MVRRIAAHPGTTALSLRAFLQTPHAAQRHWMSTPEETDNIISYTRTLKGD